MQRDNRQILHPIIGIIGILLFLVWAFFVERKPSVIPFQFADLLPKSTINRFMKTIRFALLGGLFFSTIVLLARPQTISKDTVTNNGVDISLVLDISYSMNATDFAPNRMVAARDVLTQFVASRESDRVGLVVFAGKPFVSLPLTFDYGVIGGVLERTTTDSINQNVPGLQGTAVGDAMLSSLKQLEKGVENNYDKEREQVMILLTDGEANTGVDPVVVSQLAKEQGIKVYTVGIGSLEGGIIKFDTAFGVRSQQIPGVDESTLKEIASVTGGKYRRATDQKTFEKIFEEIATLETSDIDQEQVFAGTDALGGLLWVVLVILVLLLVEAYFFTYNSASLRQKILLRMLVCVTIITLLNPGKAGKNIGGSATMIMLDVSTSMYVEDINYRGQQISRIVAAKTMIEQAVTKNPSALFGLGAFAGEAVGVLPLTTEVNTLLSLLGGIDAGTFTKQGTSVNEALNVAVDRFIGPGNDQGKTIVLITDGGEDEVTISEGLKERIEEAGISLVGIALGSEQGGAIPVGRDAFGGQQFKTYQGEVVISKVNSEALEEGFASVEGDVKRVQGVDDFDVLSELVNEGSGGVQSSQAGRIKRFCLWMLFIGVMIFAFMQTTVFISFLGDDA